MGRQVLNTGAWGYMQQTIIAKPQDIGDNLFNTETESLTAAQTDALWNDPDFGFNTPNNFFRYDPLVYGRDPFSYVQLANELKMHFGLSQN